MSRVRVSVISWGFLGGRIGIWVGFSPGFSCFPLPQISLHHFSTLLSFISLHLPLCWCQTWLASILAVHRPSIKGLHRISSLNLTPCVGHELRILICFYTLATNKMPQFPEQEVSMCDLIKLYFCRWLSLLALSALNIVTLEQELDNLFFAILIYSRNWFYLSLYKSC